MPEFLQPVIDLFKPEGYFVTKFQKITLETWIIIGLIVVAAIALALFAKFSKKKTMSTKMLSIGALCLATSFVLSYIRILDLPQGGSVTILSLLPLIIFAYIYGPVHGLTVCFAYSLLQIIQGPYIVHWAQFILDYPLAFTLVGLAGFCSKNIVLGTIVGYVARYVCHVLSGAIFYAEYAEPSGFSSGLVYSIFYNGFAIVEMVLCLIVLAIPAIRKMIRNLKVQYGKK